MKGFHLERIQFNVIPRQRRGKSRDLVVDIKSLLPSGTSDKVSELPVLSVASGPTRDTADFISSRLGLPFVGPTTTNTKTINVKR